jgi:DNA invertase Pin-like site-specific DNA recombinase
MRKPKARTENRRTVAYVRVSTEDQATDGVSLDAQEARIGAYAIALGFEVSEVIRDAGASAKSLQRPGMLRLLDGVRFGEIGRVVILKLDRITRSTRDLATLLDVFAASDAALVSVSEHLDTASAAGRLVVNMLGVVAQWEREVIGERTASALAHKRCGGSVYGPTPFGYRREGATLVPVVVEQAALREAQRLDAAGASFHEIAAMLTERGTMPHPGKERWRRFFEHEIGTRYVMSPPIMPPLGSAA